MLWVDKHRPTSLDECDYHKDLSTMLKQLAQSDDFPHLLFYGPSGAGKKTRVLALLQELFGEKAGKVKSEQRSFDIPNKTTSISLTTVSSQFHIEMSPSECGYHDRIVVQEIIKEIAQSRPLETSVSSKPFKVVVLNAVDELSQAAQAGLRRTMEKYMSTCRLILCCNSLSKIIGAVRSRCLCLRVSAPTMPEIQKVLQDVSAKESINLPPKLSALISKKSNRNLRRAVMSLQSCYVEQYPFNPDQRVPQPDWETFIAQIGTMMITEQTPKQLLAIRNKFYELLVHCIPPQEIIKKLALCLVENLDISIKYEVVYWTAHYEHRLQEGSKAIFHLEAFAAKFMSLYKDFLIQNNMSTK
eukprot:TRINITY_DN8740_c0_g1_i1.p1 TRINITY_DN8740_c0_g1~~TRINITY_DN8740_c0_g1_i1.p1  ORF type:complete len:357 (+),score=61.36 TRINITY_DN8740_c0_g1_i1:13-1083(+)